MKEIYCKDCREKLPEDDKVCPNCGGKKRNIVVILEDKIELHDQIKGKIKENGFRRPVKEFKVGDDLYRKSGKWSHIKRHINRKDDYYKEIVKDKTTGEIIHKCEEPLSKHRGHGSAKYKRKSKDEQPHPQLLENK
ncbi:hypothetical protein PW5551_10215 [Petrotoga sp. 9PW.55.5.1]|uniref:zinc ribbon domain-containing protein n=1 Tax=Petrotoga sp. 9PW.55.5.1 TaxID=1308979 RepID=UPI000DC442AC|nr:zinc ribbon domain-containing protein [Petrotoga sp. 9PW.55.5.1]RAO98373.1 hypothetical protein PW5551_10215 [Petrotoga sp. 9PW.55.5.1]